MTTEPRTIDTGIEAGITAVSPGTASGDAAVAAGGKRDSHKFYGKLEVQLKECEACMTVIGQTMASSASSMGPCRRVRLISTLVTQPPLDPTEAPKLSS